MDRLLCPGMAVTGLLLHSLTTVCLSLALLSASCLGDSTKGRAFPRQSAALLSCGVGSDPQRAATAPRGPHFQRHPAPSWLLPWLPSLNRPLETPLLPNKGKCFRLGAPIGDSPYRAAAPACSTLPIAAAAAAEQAEAPLGRCTWQQAPRANPEAFGWARRWLVVARHLRGARTSEDCLMKLMQLGLERPASQRPSSSEPCHSSLGGLEDTPGGLSGVEGQVISERIAALQSKKAGTTKTVASEARQAESFCLHGPTQTVKGCAAAASVCVSLRAPRESGSASCYKNKGSSLCCAAAARGMQVHVQGSSDSLIVGGLLQLLCRGFNGAPPCAVWAFGALGPRALLRRCGLLPLLPESRVQGLRKVLDTLEGATEDLMSRFFASEGRLAAAFTTATAAPKTNIETPTAGAERGRESSATAATAAAHKGRAVRQEHLEDSVTLQLPSKVSQGSQIPPTSASSKKTRPLPAQDAETAASVATSRASLPAVGGAGDEVHVLLSGGVDSSVSLMLLRELGFRPKPVFLKVWAPEASQLQQQQQQQQGALAAAAAAKAACPWQEDVEAAAAAAAAADLRLEVFPMQRQYWDRVIANFLEGARAGLTLNPDWGCNSHVKFGAFAEVLGETQTLIASGHYARVQLDECFRVPRLYRGLDTVKDQSYFLSGLKPQQLSRLLLPVGSLQKSQVRQLAARWGLPSARRPDSQGLCFLGPLAVGPFLSHLLGKSEGPVVHFPSGHLIGRHEGLWGFTAGQQKGVVPLLDPRLCRRCRAAPGGPPTLSGPWSVVGKLPEANALFVVSKEEEAAAEHALRTLALASKGYGEGIGDALLKAAEAGDFGALLGLKLRQLRTHLRVDNIKWIAGPPPPEFSSSKAALEGPAEDCSGASSAGADAAAAAALQGASILSGKPPTRALNAPPSKTEGGLLVQVRHSAAFDGVSKHRFTVLRATRATSGAQKEAKVTTEAELLLEEPDVGLAPGQVAAFYRGEECLGAGQISPLQGLSLLNEALEKGKRH